MTDPTPPAVSEAMREAVARDVVPRGLIEAAMRNRIRVDASGMIAGIASYYLDGFEAASADVQALYASEIARFTEQVSYLAGDRDDAREGERRWALRCGTVLGKTPEHDAPAEPGRLGFVTMTGRHEQSAWDGIPAEARQRWAYVEGAYLTRWDADQNRLTGERDAAREDLRTSNRERNEAIETAAIAHAAHAAAEAEAEELLAGIQAVIAARDAAEAALSRLQADRYAEVGRLRMALKLAVQLCDRVGCEDITFEDDGPECPQIHAADRCNEIADALGIECGGHEWFDIVKPAALTETPDA